MTSCTPWHNGFTLACVNQNAQDNLTQMELAIDLAPIMGTAALRTSVRPAALVHGLPVSWEAAVEEAFNLLRASRRIACVGLAKLTMEAARSMVKIAQHKRGCVLPWPHFDSPLRLTQPVTQTATLGQLMACDLILGAGVSRTKLPTRLQQNIRRFEALPNALPATLQFCQAILDKDDSHPLVKLLSHCKSAGVVLAHDTDPRAISQWHATAAAIQHDIRMAVVTLPHPEALNARGVEHVLLWSAGCSSAAGGVDFKHTPPRPCPGWAKQCDTLPDPSNPQGLFDLIIDTSLEPLQITGETRVIHIGSSPSPTAAVSFIVPDIARGTQGHVMRFDDVIVNLTPKTQHPLPDLTTQLLDEMVDKLQATDDSPQAIIRVIEPSPATSLRITGGLVVDPANHAQPVQRDLLIHDGKVVESLPADAKPHAKTIDATNMLIMPGGVDMHTHIASVGINTARALQAGVTFQGHPLVPSAHDTGLLYSRMGYTTAIEAAVWPSDALHAHMQLREMPNLDTGILVLVDNHQLLIDLLTKDDLPGATSLVHDLIAQSGALGMKVVNPAGVTAWRSDPACDQIDSIDQPVPPGSTPGNNTGSSVTPRKILQALATISEKLDLPHPVHIHGNRLGMPGNFQTLIDSLEAIEGRRAHIAHLQFYGYGQSPKGSYTSAAQALCDYFARHPNVTADVGMVMFGDAFTVTADSPLEHNLWRQTGSPGRPAFFCEGEREAALGVMPAQWSRKNRIHSLQWAIGMEMLLLMENPWQIALTIDHPNGGSFLHLPAIAAMLMHKPLRDEMLATIHPWARKRTKLGDITREMTASEIAILTRAAPARMLGLKHKGHLGPGADADIACYDHNHGRLTPDALARPAQVFKQGVQIWGDVKPPSQRSDRGHTWPCVPGRVVRAALEPRHAETPPSPLGVWKQHAGSLHPSHGLTREELARMLAISR